MRSGRSQRMTREWVRSRRKLTKQKGTRMYMVAIGNPFDGITLVGPFDTVSDASEWAAQNVNEPEWNAVLVKTPEAYEAE